MEKRSHRRIRDLVAHPAFQGLDVNEIGCVRISIMAASNALHLKGRIQIRETSNLLTDQIMSRHSVMSEVCPFYPGSAEIDRTTPIQAA